MAMGRSNPVPDLCRSAGDKLTVIFLGCSCIPEFFKAQGVGETVYNDIDEADIDISSAAVEGMSGNGGEAAAQEAPPAAQEAPPAE